MVVPMVDPIAQESMLFGKKRRAVEARCAELRAGLDDLDADLAAMMERRKALVDELQRLGRRLLTTLERRGRRPAVEGTVQLPPIRADATFVHGRRLRALCLALLDRFGAQSLVELHVQLHRHGFAVDGRRPVQVLADTLGYEHDRGRVTRIARGVYELRSPVPPRVKRLLAG
jgi:hypothetical protein